MEYRIRYDAFTSLEWSRWYLCDDVQGALGAFRSESPRGSVPPVLCLQVRKPGPTSRVRHLIRHLAVASFRILDEIFDTEFILTGAIGGAFIGIAIAGMRLGWF